MFVSPIPLPENLLAVMIPVVVPLSSVPNPTPVNPEPSPEKLTAVIMPVVLTLAVVQTPTPTN